MKTYERDMRHHRDILQVSAWVLLIAMFVMVVWLVQQSKHQSAQLAALLLQERQLTEKMTQQQTRHVQQQAVQQDSIVPVTPPEKKSGLPKDAQALLEKALIEARQLRKLAKSGKYKKANVLIKGLKSKIWQASDMLPKAKQTSLRKLMGVLDYTSSQLKQGKTGDTKTPLHTVKHILDGKDG